MITKFVRGVAIDFAYGSAKMSLFLIETFLN